MVMGRGETGWGSDKRQGRCFRPLPGDRQSAGSSEVIDAADYTTVPHVSAGARH